MAFRRLVFNFLLAGVLSSQILAISSVSELFVSPKATMPERGTVEYGIEYYYESRQNYFYKFSLSDNFQIGMNVTQDFDTLMAMHSTVFDFELFSAKHYIGGGYKNLGWDLTVDKYNTPVIGKYGVYSVYLPHFNSSYHLGLAQYKVDSQYYFTAGAEYNFKMFKTMAEWDGRQVHFTLQYNIFKNYDFFVVLTPAPYDGLGVSDSTNLAVSVLRRDLFFNQKNQIDELNKKYTNLKKYVDVLDSKLEVVREFSSTDFLEEFQQFMLQEHMVEKELTQEKKSIIRSALDHMQRGLEFYYKGQFNLALQEYKLVVELVPNFSMGYTRLGSIYYKLDDLKNAKLNWEKALALDPSNQSLKVFLKRVTPIDVDEKETLDLPDSTDNFLDIIPSEEQI